MLNDKMGADCVIMESLESFLNYKKGNVHLSMSGFSKKTSVENDCCMTEIEECTAVS